MNENAIRVHGHGGAAQRRVRPIDPFPSAADVVGEARLSISTIQEKFRDVSILAALAYSLDMTKKEYLH